MSPLTREPGQVVAGLVHGVGRTAEQSGHQGAQALVGDAGDGEHAGAQGAGQGLDPRVAEPQGRGPPAILGEGGPRDPLKGWTRKDAALADTFSIEQCGVDRTGTGLQFIEMDQPPQTAQVVRVVDHGLDPQRAPVLQILFDAGVPVEGVDVDLGAVGDDLGLELTGGRSTTALAASKDRARSAPGGRCRGCR